MKEILIMIFAAILPNAATDSNASSLAYLSVMCSLVAYVYSEIQNLTPKGGGGGV